METNFYFAKFKFILKAVDTIHLPYYKGSTFRGGFGSTFKKVACCTHKKDCSDCLLKDKCSYSYIFETPPPSDTKLMRKYPYAPHPFIIEPPMEDKREYKPESLLNFNLILIGKAIDYLPYFVYTFDELGKVGVGRGRGKYELVEVKGFESLNPVKEKVIYSNKDKLLKNVDANIYWNDIVEIDSSQLSNLNSISLSFLTPTRIKYKERLVKELQFHTLIRSLLRRISLLSYFHCSEELDINFKEIIEESEKVKVKESSLRWEDWERYSSRQDTRMKLGGFKGSITFEGNLSQFLPYIFLGEYIHTGKNTAFGLGKYEISNNL